MIDQIELIGKLSSTVLTFVTGWPGVFNDHMSAHAITVSGRHITQDTLEHYFSCLSCHLTNEFTGCLCADLSKTWAFRS